MKFASCVDVAIPDGFFGSGDSRKLPENGDSMDLTFLVSVLRPGGAAFKDFLPNKIFVREEMETAFRELLNNGSDVCTVFSGSPGIGKSVLTFLLVLYSVWKNNEKAVYIRHVEESSELVSVFAMHRLENGLVQIRFDRELSRALNIPILYDTLRGSFEGVKWTSRMVAAVDGPPSTQLTNYSKVTIGCTCGAGIRIKDHMVGLTFNVVMGA